MGGSVLVLFDSRATHSFLSNASVSKVSLEKHDLDLSCWFQLHLRVRWLPVWSV